MLEATIILSALSIVWGVLGYIRLRSFREFQMKRLDRLVLEIEEILMSREPLPAKQRRELLRRRVRDIRTLLGGSDGK
jgi:hypothetical protein